MIPDDPENAKIYVANLPLNVTEDNIHQLFSKYGDILDMRFLNNKGQSNTRVYITYSKTESARNAVASLNYQDYQGNSLIVQLTKKKFTGQTPKREISNKVYTDYKHPQKYQTDPSNYNQNTMYYPPNYLYPQETTIQPQVFSSYAYQPPSQQYPQPQAPMHPKLDRYEREPYNRYQYPYERDRISYNQSDSYSRYYPPQQTYRQYPQDRYPPNHYQQRTPYPYR